MLENIAQCIPQMIVQDGQEDVWGDLPEGCITERLMTMDGLEPCGHTQQISCFPEIGMLLTARELPQVYENTKTNGKAIFDITQG